MTEEHHHHHKTTTTTDESEGKLTCTASRYLCIRESSEADLINSKGEQSSLLAFVVAPAREANGSLQRFGHRADQVEVAWLVALSNVLKKQKVRRVSVTACRSTDGYVAWWPVEPTVGSALSPLCERESQAYTVCLYICCVSDVESMNASARVTLATLQY